MLVLGTYSDPGMGLLTIPKQNLLYHTAIIGQSGSGKSFAIARLVEELMLRSRARIVVLDPNGDFSHSYAPAGDDVWQDEDFQSVFSNISKRLGPNVDDYDRRDAFEAKWLSRRFQFVSADRYNWAPFRSGANAAPLRLHWKWLGSEQDFLLNVDATLYPKINQGVVSCFHYIDDNRERYPQGYSLEDLEAVAQAFALKEVVMADYPDAHSLDGVDWLAVRLQFRQLRKRFYRMWFPGALKEQATAPSDLSNYLANGFRQQAPWQLCVVGLAGLDVQHMLLAADAALYQLWNRSIAAWQQARELRGRKAEEEFYGTSRQDETQLEALPAAPSPEGTDPSTSNTLSGETPVETPGWQDRRVPTFVIIDEAHNFAPQEPTSPLQARVSEKIASIAAEGRKYGLFVLLATQRPQKLRRGLLAECENSAIMRLQSKVEQTFAHEALGIPLDTLTHAGKFEEGEALMTGRWVAGMPTCRFAPARTRVGGGGLDKKYWLGTSR